jgi:hypothetical protein
MYRENNIRIYTNLNTSTNQTTNLNLFVRFEKSRKSHRINFIDNALYNIV